MSIFRDVFRSFEAEIVSEVIEIYNPCTGPTLTGGTHGGAVCHDRSFEAEIASEVIEIYNPCTGSSLTGATHGAGAFCHDPQADFVWRFLGHGSKLKF